ncbi:MAG TPA: AAA family ATPase [Solirubrobacterales bacterium]|nr:AAA family ATPase [Solirubrobacterales bacterium]
MAEAGTHFRTDTRAARQRKYDFEGAGLLGNAAVLRELGRISAGRCMFCGSPGGRGLRPHRFRPPQDAIAADGSTSRRHYWWLAFEWENVYFACGDCHFAQGAKFPVANKRVRVGAKRDLNAKEEPLLIDPFEDDPEAIFIYLDSGEVVAPGGRGETTIETFDLNRPQLRAERQSEIAEVRGEIRVTGRSLDRGFQEEFTTKLIDLYSQEPAFAALRRQFVNQWVQFRSRRVERALAAATSGEITLASLVGSLQRVTNQRKAEADAVFFGKPLDLAVAEPVVPKLRESRYEVRARPEPEAARESLTPYLEGAEIRSVEVENFRAIERLRLEFPLTMGESNWLMLLGENGAGKTSVLQALGLALCDEQTRERLRLDPHSLLRHGTEEGRVTITLTGSRRGREMRFGRSGLEVVGAPEKGVLIAGYGSMRLLLDHRAKPPRRSPKHSKIANLFDPLSFLVQPREWLPNLRSDQFDAVARALSGLLQLDPDQEIRRSKRGLQIIGDNGSLELGDLSDGYKTMAVFALDMMQLFIQRWGTIEAAEGIVLVDELGAHLHPTWQMRVTESLRETFPRVQFVATTHDPLCLRGLRDGEVVVLRRRGEAIYALHDELPPVEGLAVDQLLTSEHFGLNSTLDPVVESLFTHYYDLLSRRERNPDEEEELDALKKRLEGLRLLGRTRRERLALEATDTFLAEEQQRTDPRELSVLKDATKRKIAGIWRAG